MDWDTLSVCLLAFAVYSNTLQHGFVYDDNRAILTNPDILTSSNLFNVFQNDFWGTPMSSSNSHGSYRPLCILSFRFNHWTSGFYPYGFHLTNVLLHVLATALVLKTARLLLPGRSPTTAAALFAVHPVHVEAVAGLVGRADVLSSIFYLSAFLFYAKHVKVRDSIFLPKVTIKGCFVRLKTTNKKIVLSKKTMEKTVTDVNDLSYSKCARRIFLSLESQATYFVLFLVFSVCAILSKEPGIAVLPLAVGYDIILHLRSRKLWKLNPCVIISASASFLTFIIIILGRFCIMGSHTPTFSKADNPTAKDTSWLTRTLTFLYLPVFNFLLLVFPRHLSFDWSMDAIPKLSSLLDQRSVLIFGFYIVLYSIVKASLKRVHKRRSNLKAQICNVCNVSSNEDHVNACKIINNNNIPLSCSCRNPSSSTLSFRSITMMCLAFTILPFLPATNLFFYVGFVVAERVLYIPSIGFCLMVSLGVHSLWTSHRLLVLVGCTVLIASLGARTLQRNADWRNEETLYRSAVHVNPPKAYGNLGAILSTAGRLAEAEDALRTALSHRPNMADVHHNLGNLLTRQAKYTEALESYKFAIQYRPSLAAAHLNSGKVFETLGQLESAEKMFKKCYTLDVTGLKDPKHHEESRSACFQRLYMLCSYYSCDTGTIRLLNNKNIRTKDVPRPKSSAKAQDISSQVDVAKLLARNRSTTSEAEDIFLRAIKKSPSDPAAYVNYGQLLVGKGQHAEAAALYHKAAQLSPQHFFLVNSAAIAMRQAGRLEEAEGLYRQARDLKPEDATSHSNLGAILHLQGKYRQAASCYREALRLSPGDQVTLANLQKLRNILSRNKR